MVGTPPAGENPCKFAGVPRPLTRLQDYDDWKGHEARIHPHEPYQGRKQLSGDLIGVDGETVRILVAKADSP